MNFSRNSLIAMLLLNNDPVCKIAVERAPEEDYVSEYEFKEHVVSLLGRADNKMLGMIPCEFGISIEMEFSIMHGLATDEIVGIIIRPILPTRHTYGHLPGRVWDQVNSMVYRWNYQEDWWELTCVDEEDEREYF